MEATDISFTQEALEKISVLKCKKIGDPQKRQTNDFILTCEDQNNQKKLLVIKRTESKNVSQKTRDSRYLMQYEWQINFPNCRGCVLVYDAKATLKDILKGSNKKKDTNNNNGDACLSEEMFLRLAANLSLAVEDCHQHNDTNLQLSPENIYQAKNEQLKLDSYKETIKSYSPQELKTYKETDLKALKRLLLFMIFGPGQNVDQLNETQFETCHYNCKNEIKKLFQKLCKTEWLASYPAEVFCKLYIQHELIELVELDKKDPQQNSSFQLTGSFLHQSNLEHEDNIGSVFTFKPSDQANSNLKQLQLQKQFSLCLPEVPGVQHTRRQSLSIDKEKEFFEKTAGLFNSVDIDFPFKTFEEWAIKEYAFLQKDSNGRSYVCLFLNESFLQNRSKTKGIVVYASLGEIEQVHGIDYIIYNSELEKIAKEIYTCIKDMM